MSKAGLLQVLINLLKFYSSDDSSMLETLPVINELKNFISLINRALLKFNENQDSDNFSYFVNSLVSFFYFFKVQKSLLEQWKMFEAYFDD